MARASLIQNTVNAGELSTLLLGRQDIAKYISGLRVCLNAIPLTQGAWTRRPGTVFLNQTRHHDKVSRLLPFQYSVTQTYVLEIGEFYIRFYTDHGILASASNSISGITKATPAVLTYTGTDNFSNGDRVYISGVVGMTQVNGREFVVTNVDTAANTFQLYDSSGSAVDSIGYTTYSSGGTVSKILEVTTLFQEADIADVRITQSADILYIFHPDHPPQQLVRNTATSWTLSDIALSNGPWGENDDDVSTTMTPNAATGTATVTASSINGINNNTGFQTTDVGRLLRVREGSTWGWGTIVGRLSTTVVTVSISATFTDTTSKSEWALGLWSDSTGFPTCGTFHEDRLFMAGAATSPQRLDGSKTGQYRFFNPSANDGTIADDNAVAFTINSDDVNAIKWMGSNEKGLIVGTTRGEWMVRPSALNEALSPTNISAKPATNHGSASVAPVFPSSVVLFVQRAGRKLRELAYVFEADGFKSPDMTLLAEHITRPSITELAFQEQPQAIVWAVRSDGVLLGFTYERDQDVVAWHRHELGGTSNSAGTAIPIVESVATVSAPDDDRDELYLIAQRYVNGGTKRYVEYMSKLWEEGDEQEDAFHLDCGFTVVNGSPSASVTGLWHLEGQTVAVYADGAAHPDVTITNGIATLNYTATEVTLGYAYDSDGQTLPFEGGSRDGTSQAKTKRINQVGFWLMDTLGMKYGPDADNLTEILQRRYGDDFGEATELFTGVTTEVFASDYDMLGQVYWRCSGPFPATVMAIMPSIKVAD